MAEVIAFDYSDFDKDTKGKLVYLAGQIKRHSKTFIQTVMENGQAIHEAHELLAGNGREGKFREWVEIETNLAISTAYEWKNVYIRAKKYPTIGNFSPTVAYILSGPTVPDEAIVDFEKQVNKGARPTAAAAKATVEKFKEMNSDKPATTRAPKNKPGKVRSQSDEPSNGPPDEPEHSDADEDAPIATPPETPPKTDAYKVPVSPAVVEAFAACTEFRSLMVAISACKTRVDGIVGKPGGEWVDGQEANRLLEQARILLRFAMPHTECAKCRRKIDKKCPACNGLGWVNESIERGSFSADDKEWCKSGR